MLFFCILGVLPVLPVFIGVQFLPAPEWVESSFWVSIISGISLSILWVWLIRKGRENCANSGLRQKGLYLYLVSPALAFLFAILCVTATGPMFVALFIGDDTKIEFEVRDATASYSKHCRRPIEFAGFPSVLNRICGASEGFRGSLDPGSIVEVSGRGTQFGVFFENVRKAD